MKPLPFFVLVATVLFGVAEVAAAPLIIDGNSTAGNDLTTCPGTESADHKSCTLGGRQTFDYIEIKNGGTLYVTAFDNNPANKATRGNLELIATGRDPTNTFSIKVDAWSRISAKGAGYQAKLCDNGPGPLGTVAGGRGGCAVKDSGGGGAHRGRGGKGTKDCFVYGAADTCTFPQEWEEACGSLNTAGNACNYNGTSAGHQCLGTEPCANCNDNPPVNGEAFSHSIYTPEFGAAGGDKGCADGWDGALRAGDGGGRIVLFADTGVVQIDGRISADGARGCSSGNDSAGGGAGGTILVIGDQVNITDNARISAHGGRGGDSQPKALTCTANGDCGANQSCRTFWEPWYTGGSPVRTSRRCDPANCTPCGPSNSCPTGHTCTNLGGDLGNVCVPSSRPISSYPTGCTAGNSCNGGAGDCIRLNGTARCVPKNQPVCDVLEQGDDEQECSGTQNNGTCDDCAGGGGGGLITVQSRSKAISPMAIFDVRGALGGICPICAGESGGGAGEIQLDGAYVGEICDNYDNDFDLATDEGLGNITCPTGSQPACASGIPQDCTYDSSVCATPTSDTRPRFALIVDTSGSMLYDLRGYPTFGDGSIRYPGVDTGADANGLPDDARLYMAKRAITNVLSAFPENDFALARYFQDAGLNRSCQTASAFECAMSCCSYDNPTVDHAAPAYPEYYPGGSCIFSTLYSAAGYGGWANTNINVDWASDLVHCINYAGSCGPPRRGAQFLVGFGSSLDQYLKWLDGAENDFRDTVVEGSHCAGGDCELRGTGPTPLAGALQATQSYLTPVVTCDGARACRTYSTILLTDGVESCQGDPVTAATALRTAVTGKEIKTYVIGFSVLASEQAQLDAIANAGGTQQAVFATNENDVGNAIATIVANSQVFEACNGIDDDCDLLVDEGFGVFQYCTSGPECSSGQCAGGRCRCVDDSQCDAGFACDTNGGFCRPACQAGAGACLRRGLVKCDGCCENDGQSTCTALAAGSGSAEICNYLDDDCDGQVDEGLSCQGCIPQAEICNGLDDDCSGVPDDHLTDTGQPCGLNIGICNPGTTACQDAGTLAAKLICQGAGSPAAEVCDGLDNDCDGVTDGMTRTCYTGPVGTENLGVCHGGRQACTAVPGSGTPQWGACTGQVTPALETCNGLDDNCDGTPDNVAGVGDTCCAYLNGTGNPICGVGACTTGTRQCQNGALACVGGTGPATEVCNNVDDDCNGLVDDLPTGRPGQSCCPSGLCGTGICGAGTFACQDNQLVCQNATGPTAEVCNTLDDDCNGTADDLPGAGGSCCPAGVPCGVGICVPGTLGCDDSPQLECMGYTVPATEVCNGQDDDCNGTADDVTGVGTACCTSGKCGVGLCESGSMQCQANALICIGEILPQAETCNGVDDNCNSVVDDLDGSGAECCPFVDGAGQPLCGHGICQVGHLGCGAGSATLQCLGGVGPGVEVCNGLDDDCNGAVDDVPGTGSDCCPSGKCGVGVCRSGTYQCQGNQVVCRDAVGPSAEVCNGADDDCSGTVDDLPGLGTSCCPKDVPCGVGICEPGQLGCTSGSLQPVCLEYKPPQTEVCNGLDDDCNGVVDDVATAGQDCCASGHCGVGICRAGQLRCEGTELVCNGEVSPGAEVCNGLDDDCNGTVDDAPGVHDACCPYQDASRQPLCGHGICQAGRLECVPGSSTPQCREAVGPTVELCNGLDDDCNGVVDDLSSGTVGQSCCPSGKCGLGVCQAGTLRCGPSGLECQNAINPSGEVCNGLDDDCNGTVDDVPGIGTVCCPSGRCGSGVCQSGTLVCSAGGLTCQGATAPGDEVCNGLDDDCNGTVDDVTGVGEPCCPDGSPAPEGCNRGICRPGVVACEGSALACRGGQSAGSEICDGLDNNCNGSIDETVEVEANDPNIGQACDVPIAPNDQAPCEAGATVCEGGKAVCRGSVAGKDEICNGKDEDCDGIIDEGDLCEEPKACVASACRNPCGSSEFECPGGLICRQGYCVPLTAGTGGAGGRAGAGGEGALSQAGATGGSIPQGATAGAANGETAHPDGGGKAEDTLPSTPAPSRNWGLATGGGGCSCHWVRPPRSRSALLLLLGLAALIGARRRSRGGAQ